MKNVYRSRSHRLVFLHEEPLHEKSPERQLCGARSLDNVQLKDTGGRSEEASSRWEVHE